MVATARQILIIDDDDDIRRYLKKALEGSGFLTHETASVDAALSFLASAIPHLIILDLKMPGKTGIDFLKERLNMDSIARIPVIVLSASQKRDEIQTAISLGASTFLMKPFNTQVLTQRIRQALSSNSKNSMSYTFSSPIKAQVVIRGQLTHISDESAALLAPVKIKTSDKVIIQSAFLKKTGFNQEAFRWLPTDNSSTTAGLYTSVLNYAGVDPKTLDRFRNFMRTWGKS